MKKWQISFFTILLSLILTQKSLGQCFMSSNGTPPSSTTARDGKINISIFHGAPEIGSSFSIVIYRNNIQYLTHTITLGNTPWSAPGIPPGQGGYITETTVTGLPEGVYSGSACNQVFSLNLVSVPTWYKDADKDHYYMGTGITQTSSPGPDYAKTGLLGGNDCNDSDQSINPGAPEICGNNTDENCNGQLDDPCVSNIVKDVKIDTTIGKLIETPLSMVKVEAYRNGELINTTTTDNSGKFSFINLDTSLPYSLKFHYKDMNNNNENLYIDLIDPTTSSKNNGDILLPYTMMKQTRQLLARMRDKPNYEIKYLWEILNLNQITAQSRKVYELKNIEALIYAWQSTDISQSKIVIEKLGRVYISLFASDAFSNNAYELSKIPAKSLSEFIGLLTELLKLADIMKKWGETPDESLGFIVEDVQQLVNTAIKSAISMSLKFSTEALKLRLETLQGEKEKAIVNKLLSAIKVLQLTIKSNKEIGISAILDLCKEFVNNKIFMFMYERYIDATQELIDDTHSRGALAYNVPKETFEMAAQKVFLQNASSLVYNADAKTKETIDLCENVFFNNVDKLDMLLTIEKSFRDLAAISKEVTKVTKAASFLKKISGIFSAFKILNYAGALYSGLNRYIDNEKEQAEIPAISFNPALRISGNAKNRGFSIAGFSPQVNAYNSKLDSIIQLIRNKENIKALKKTKELDKLDSTLNVVISYSGKKIAGVAAAAAKTIPNFDSLYLNNFIVPYNNTFFLRSGMTFNLATWFLDTTSTSFIDTLTEFASKTKISNLAIADAAVYIDNLTNNTQAPPKVSIIGIDAPTEMIEGFVSPIKIRYENLGSDMAKEVYIKVKADGGFGFAIDSLYLGNILSGQAGEVTLQITSPLVDTFTLFNVTINTGNGMGDYETGYIFTRENADVLPINLLSFSGKLQNNNALLQWQTSGEKNMKIFELERSIDNTLNFKKIAVINAANFIGIQNYNYNDAADILADSKYLFYRLKIVDKDGKFNFSNIVKLSNSNNSKLSVFPNPSANTVKVSGLIGKGTLILISIEGKEITKQITSAQSEVIDLSNLLKGIYFLQYNNGQKIVTLKIIKE